MKGLLMIAAACLLSLPTHAQSQEWEYTQVTPEGVDTHHFVKIRKTGLVACKSAEMLFFCRERDWFTRAIVQLEGCREELDGDVVVLMNSVVERGEAGRTAFSLAEGGAYTHVTRVSPWKLRDAVHQSLRDLHLEVRRRDRPHRAVGALFSYVHDEFESEFAKMPPGCKMAPW